MLTKLKRIILSVNEVISLEINLLDDERVVINGVHIKNKGSKIVKINAYEKINGYEGLRNKLPEKLPVIVTVTGKGVLFRKKQGPAQSSAIKEHLPGSNPNDFYFQTFSNTTANFSFIVRRELMNKVLEKLRKQKYKVLDLFIGVSPIQNILPFIDAYSYAFATSSCVVKVNNGEISDIEPTVTDQNAFFEEQLVGQQYFKTNALTALGAAINFFVNSFSDVSPAVNISEIKEVRKNFLQQKYLTFLSFSMLSSVFIILLANYFIFNYYFNKNLKASSLKLQTTMANLRSKMTQEKVDSNFELLEKAGWDKPARQTYFIDRIAALIPGSVVLTSLITNPGKEEDNKYISFQSNEIIITGTCLDPIDLNDFINSIKNMEEVSKVFLKSYIYKREISSGVFTVQIIHQ